MNLTPLFDHGPVITIHVFVAIAAFVAGGLQFLMPKGTLIHKTLGYFWVSFMFFVAASSFFIHEIKMWFGLFSPIHILPFVVFTSLFFAIKAARAGKIAQHKRIMVQLYLFALVVTGALTLLPGRLMHEVVFGG